MSLGNEQSAMATILKDGPSTEGAAESNLRHFSKLLTPSTSAGSFSSRQSAAFSPHKGKYRNEELRIYIDLL